MRNKKGFTLIELLAIIVILAVIMVIAVPQILNVVNGSKNGAWKNNVSMIERAITKNSKLVDLETGFYKYSIDGLCSNTSKFKEIVKADDTSITCSNNVFTLTGTGQFTGKSATITCANNKCSVNISDSNQVELAAGLYDSSNNLIASWDELINTYHMDISGNATAEKAPIYAYLPNEFITSADNTYGVTTEGWYVVLTSDSYDITVEPVDINTINSTQPAVVLGKLIGTKKGCKLVITDKIRDLADIDDAEPVFVGTNIEELEIRNVDLYGTEFYSAYSLKKIILGKGTRLVGNMSFANCLSLTDVSMSEDMIAIGYAGFAMTPKLSNLSLGGTLGIAEDAFAMSGLKNFIVPSSVGIIGTQFLDSEEINTVTFENANNWVKKTGKHIGINTRLEEPYEAISSSTLSNQALSLLRRPSSGSDEYILIRTDANLSKLYNLFDELGID